MLLLSAALAIPLLSRAIEERFPPVHRIELLTYAWRMQGLRPIEPDRAMVLVGMDDRSCDHLFRQGLIDRPVYTRAMQARLLRELHTAGARTVAFDVYFTADAPAAETQAFAEALRDCGGAIVALQSVDAPDTSSDATTYRFTDPVPELRPYCIAGSIAFPRTGDLVQWFDPWPNDSATLKRRKHLTVLAVNSFLRETGAEPSERRDFRIGSIHAPFIDPARHVAIRFAGPPNTFVPDAAHDGAGRPKNYLSYEQVYTGEWRRSHGPEFLRDKLVLVGRMSPQEDRVLTPRGDMAGVELLANTIQTLLQRNWIRGWTYGENYLVMLAFCFAVALTVWRFNLLWAGSAAAVASLLWLAVSGWLFAVGQWADTVDPILAAGLTFAAASAIEAWKTRGVFKRFVPSQVADDILRAPDAATTERDVAIAFCDIRSYTVLSERLAPEQAEALLHTYFRAGEAAADRFGGVLDKFVGDGMMLYFEAKRGREPHVLRAVRWALAMQEQAAAIDRSGDAGETGFKIGIGVAAGPVRFGRVQARQRLQHTVIGDAVNLASRLQSATKELGVGILLSGAGYERIKDSVDAERLGEIAVKGKQEPQVVYHPTGVLT